MSSWLKPFLWIGRFLHWVRLTLLNLLTLLILAVVGVVLLKLLQPVAPLPSDGVLVIAPHGTLRYAEPSPWADSLPGLGQSATQDVVVHRLVRAIDAAAQDPHIRLLELNLSDFGGGSITELNTVAKALRTFRASGKPIYAFAPDYSQASYFLAAQANQVFLPHLGVVLFTGFTTKGLYFKDFFDKIGVKVYSFRQGKYKSAMEPLIRSDMSAAAREENEEWLKVWWHTYAQGIAQGRNIPVDRVDRYASKLPELIQSSKGNAAQLALSEGLVTQLGDQKDFEAAIAKALHKPEKDLQRVSLDTFLQKVPTPARYPQQQIAVVPIDGMLVPGDVEKAGLVATEPTVAQLDDLRKDKAVKAVVLQVSSPGGDVTTADAIRKAILRLRKAGKPVVVSMGSLGASGAYWLSTGADRILAEPTTITADIGVFMLFPDYSGTLQKLGITVSGVSVPADGAHPSPMVPLTDNEQKAYQAVVDHLYHHFVSLVATARHLPFAQAEKDAQGRAWSGEAAYRMGLVNQLGGMREAIATAAKLAKLPPDHYDVHYLPIPEKISLQGLLGNLALGILPQDTLGLGLVDTALSKDSELAQMRTLLLAARPYGFFSYLPIDPTIR
ncbi:signal peptide peptidase SppA [Acidithiobacillus sp.]|uniref:signal peptide peptidase SppA n=1 Tax=Acidithiobacillus sp. TaxID=1872118 RepID=UPI0025BACFA5|nr:signal peptide peptidase SppA [Acidithiobacillus sp.]